MSIFPRHYLEAELEKHVIKPSDCSFPQPLHPQFPDQGKEDREWSPGMLWEEAGHKHPPEDTSQCPVLGFLWQGSNPTGKVAEGDSLSPGQLISRGVPCVPWAPGSGKKHLSNGNVLFDFPKCRQEVTGSQCRFILSCLEGEEAR